MSKDRKEKNEELGTKINLSAIVKKSKEIKGEIEVPEKKKKFYPMPIRVSISLFEKYTSLYYALMKELGEKVVMTRSDVFISIVEHMCDNTNVDISKYPDFYDKFIGAKGKRSTTSRTLSTKEETINCVWANFTKEQLLLWKKLLTKLAVLEGVEKKLDFSKQYFISDIIDYFEKHTQEIANYIKEKKAL